jgi:alpha-beta hydrolase superfamily lysophospholipase
MNERYENVKYGNEWVCEDPYVQLDHLQDPFNALTRPTNNRSLLYFMELMLSIGSIDWAAKVPSSLPILLISGDQDPVGGYGAGVYTVADWLWRTGHRPVTKLYTGYRHEIHNYPELKKEVAEDILAFIGAQLKWQKEIQKIRRKQKAYAFHFWDLFLSASVLADGIPRASRS